MPMIDALVCSIVFAVSGFLFGAWWTHPNRRHFEALRQLSDAQSALLEHYKAASKESSP